MRTTNYLLSTLKEIPRQSKIISHQLMLRAGIIQKLSSGIYSWLPTGIRILKKIEIIIREEMNKSNALEVILPIIQPINLWNESKRLHLYGNELFKLTDRYKNTFILSPTHEEVITKLINNTIYSYKQLPIILYQIQTKFRDEIRPKFGTIRAREFIMKDAYSFHMNDLSLIKTYKKMYNTYTRIFKRMSLNFCVVKADSSGMGGNVSHEFQTFSKNGDNTVVISNKSNYATNIQMLPITKKVDSIKAINNNCTKDLKYDEAEKPLKLSNNFQFPKNKFIETFLVKSKNTHKHPFVALLIRSDHSINKFKIKNVDNVKLPLKFANNEEIKKIFGKRTNSLGPIGLSIPLIVDTVASKMKNFIVGANINNKVFINVNWKRDLPCPIVADIRNINVDEISSHFNKNNYTIKQCIEIAHIFQIGENYSKKLETTIKNKTGIIQPILMGCYGIGISRVIAAIIEQNHDSRGIIWPSSISPFQVSIIPINMYKSKKVKQVSEHIYNSLKQKNIEVLFDDRNEHPGHMFSEIELIGIPHYIIISNRHLINNKIEYKERRSNKSTLISIEAIVSFIQKTLKHEENN